MAFIPGSVANKYKKNNTAGGGGFQPGSVAKKYVSEDLPALKKIKEVDGGGGFTPGSVAGQYPSAKKNLKTSQGLYDLAAANGLQGRADEILQQQEGEQPKKIFSGGFISDVFDVLNATQYGVTGLLKGKGFMEGIKTRQSFSDKDALGDKGLPGIIAGTLLDIAVDPLTYIAPWTLIKKVPAAMKIIKGAETLAFGQKVTKAIETGVEGVEKSYEALEGGSKLGKYLGQKFSWMFGQDPIYRQTFERSLTNTAIETENIVQMTKSVANLAPDTAKKLLSKDKTGRFIRTSVDDLSKVLSPEEMEPVSKLYNMIDEMGQEMVDLKLLSPTKYEQNVGEYIKNAYLEYEQMKGKGLFGTAKVGVKGVKKRVEGLTEEQMLKLGQIDNPAYLLFKTAFDMRKDIENVKLFNTIAEKFGTDVAQDGFVQLPKTSRLFTTSTGEKLEMFKKIKNLNEDLKPFFKDLKSNFKADRKVLSEIAGLEKEIGSLKSLRTEEFYKFFNEGEIITKVVPAYKSVKGAGKLPQHLQDLGYKIEQAKFPNYETFKNSDLGLQAEKLDINGDLQRSGFPSLKKFFEYIKEPFNKTEATVKEIPAIGNMKKIIKIQKALEDMGRKVTDLKEFDKRGIDDSYRFLDDAINKIQMEKEGVLENLDKVKLGELAGKYVPQPIYDSLQDIITPSPDSLAKRLIANFKFSKVIMNPGTHARNIISNTLLNWWKLGLGPWRADVYAEALNQVARGGKYVDEAKKVGYSLDTFASAEMKSLLNGPEATHWGKGVGKQWATVVKKLGDMYQNEENVAKMAAFIYRRKAGDSVQDAWKAAEAATFNYAQVTPFVRRLRESLFGFPFITFTAKATPVVLETAVKAPHRIASLGKIKQAVENLSDDEETARERAAEAPWVKDGFYVKLPMKDQHGRSAYLDLTYILPFGDLLAGNFLQKNVNQETGIRESLPMSMAKKAPFFSTITELAKNKDFYGHRIWKESDTTEQQIADIMRYLTKVMAPPLVADQIPGGYNSKGERQNKGIRGAMEASDENQQRTVMEELLRNVGAKIQPVDADIQESFQEYNKKKQLETLLLENGVLNSFNINYVPEEE